MKLTKADIRPLYVSFKDPGWVKAFIARINSNKAIEKVA